MRSLLLTLFSVAMFGLAPTVAAAHRTYTECDNAHSPDYPTVVVHPHSCNVGLGASYYDVQPVGGRSFGTIGLRRLRWHGWGRHEATAHGLACNIYGNGGANWKQCASVTVHVYRPVAVGPAGGAFIYQLMRASHTRKDAWDRFTYWYQPGTDY
jgi:hypothetical protein